MTEWIRVNQQSPLENEIVLCYGEGDSRCFLAQYLKEEDGSFCFEMLWCDDLMGWRPPDIDIWCRIPKIPEEFGGPIEFDNGYVSISQ